MFVLRSAADVLSILFTFSSKKPTSEFLDGNRQDRGTGAVFKIDLSPAANNSTAFICYNNEFNYIESSITIHKIYTNYIKHINRKINYSSTCSSGKLSGHSLSPSA